MTKVVSLTIEELEDSLNELLPDGYELKHTKHGIVIITKLKENAYGELVCESEEDDEDSIFDEDMEPLPEEDVDY